MPARHKLKHDSLGLNAVDVRRGLANHLSYSLAKDPVTATQRDWFNSVAYTVRDRLTERWIATVQNHYEQDVKRVYYLSLEFLMGRALTNSLINMGIYEQCLEALDELELPYEFIAEIEPDPALGNGGLGRLAACFLDSMATLCLPGYGYGIRYEYGMFYQRLRNGKQIEQPDNWLRYGNPWEFPRPEMLYKVHFGGNVVEYTNERGRLGFSWRDTEDVMAMAYDVPVPGYKTDTVNTLRLWTAKSSRDFNLQFFNAGDYLKSVEHKNCSENLSRVLYPDDTTSIGRELRLRQEYFFVAASLQDIIRRYLSTHADMKTLPDKIAIQLNDTHPSLAVPELMRILLDKYLIEWDEAWDMCQKIFAYTNHTLLPEALETWSISLMERLLPRHLQIIYEINHRFLREVAHRFPGDMEMLGRVSIIGEAGKKHVRMANLAIVGSHKVNGVAALHTELMKATIFADFERIFPGKIINKTNGITPRRWLNQANRPLSQLISKHVKQNWVVELDQLKQLAPLADDPQFRSAFRAVKQENKQRLAEYINRRLNIAINLDSMFDVQVKRIHEYKRQLMNLLHIITRYKRIRANPDAYFVPRTVIFAGKAAPGYHTAKLIIQLINDVADVINNDPIVHDRLKVVFIPNYDVTNAQRIIPAADLSEQISTAGMEASGTGNMKLSLNGALTIGTLDGANIEIKDEVGEDNIFIFGLTAQEVFQRKNNGYNPWDYYNHNQELREVLDMINNGYFSPEEPNRFTTIFDTLTHGGDNFMLLADYASYIDCQNQVDELYTNADEWTRKAILNVANMGKFSSDRTILEYAQEIWGLKAMCTVL